MTDYETHPANAPAESGHYSYETYSAAFPPAPHPNIERESEKVLKECIEMQLQKSRDYQNPDSRIVQADYYPRGLASIMDIINTKMLRIKSVMEAMEHDTEYEPNFESVEDSLKDLINYASFGVSWCRGSIPGQDKQSDFLNRSA